MIYDLRFTIWLKCASFALLLSTINSQLSTLHAQGSLTPPGAPAPTMKTLDQIEARTPISQLPFTIDTGGSYYLTGNLSTGASNAIVIAASGVTLDLNGYTIYSTVTLAQNGGTAILLNDGITDVTVQNGHIFSGVVHTGLGYSGSGFGSGIVGGSKNIHVRNISISGCLYYGIWVGGSFATSQHAAEVESCQVQTTGASGIIAATVRNCSALDCGDDAIVALQVFDSQGVSSVIGSGMLAYYTAQNCYGYSAANIGMTTSLALNSRGESASNDGLHADNAENCTGISHGSGYSGIYAFNNTINCFGSTAGNGYGIQAATAQNCEGDSYGSGFGLYASYNALGCYGLCQTSSGVGIHAYNAAYCVAQNYGGGTALQTTMATGCINYQGTTSATYKYNMP